MLQTLIQLRRRLGDTTMTAPIDHVDFACIPPDKPKRMHWRTYHRLCRQFEEIEREAARLFHVQAARVLGRFAELGASVP